MFETEIKREVNMKMNNREESPPPSYEQVVGGHAGYPSDNRYRVNEDFLLVSEPCLYPFGTVNTLPPIVAPPAYSTVTAGSIYFFYQIVENLKIKYLGFLASLNDIVPKFTVLLSTH